MRINVQAEIISCASWNCCGFLGLLRLFLVQESRVLAHANEKSMGKILSLLCRAGLALVVVAFQRWLLGVRCSLRQDSCPKRLPSAQRDYRPWEVTSDLCINTSTCMATEVSGKVAERCRQAQQALGACSCLSPAQACTYAPLATYPSHGFAGSPGMSPRPRDLLPLGRWLRAEEKAMSETIWDEKDSGDKKTAVRTCYEKPLG